MLNALIKYFLRDCLKTRRISVDDMKAKMEVLNTEMQAISQEMYAKAQAEQPQDGAAGGEAGGPAAGGEEPKAEKKDDADVIDADFEMVDDEKK